MKTNKASFWSGRNNVYLRECSKISTKSNPLIKHPSKHSAVTTGSVWLTPSEELKLGSTSFPSVGGTEQSTTFQLTFSKQLDFHRLINSLIVGHQLLDFPKTFQTGSSRSICRVACTMKRKRKKKREEGLKQRRDENRINVSRAECIEDSSWNVGARTVLSRRIQYDHVDAVRMHIFIESAYTSTIGIYISAPAFARSDTVRERCNANLWPPVKIHGLRARVRSDPRAFHRSARALSLWEYAYTQGLGTVPSSSVPLFSADADKASE